MLCALHFPLLDIILGRHSCKDNPSWMDWKGPHLCRDKASWRVREVPLHRDWTLWGKYFWFGLRPFWFFFLLTFTFNGEDITYHLDDIYLAVSLIVYRYWIQKHLQSESVQLPLWRHNWATTKFYWISLKSCSCSLSMADSKNINHLNPPKYIDTKYI